MVDDPYKVLGLSKTATEKQVKEAFHKIAKTSHPDLNPGDKKAEERFKAAANAHDLLSDPEKRARFDRGEMDTSGQEAPQRSYYRDHAETSAGSRYNARFSEDELSDLLSGMFRNGERPGSARAMKGRDNRYSLPVSFVQAARGGPQRLMLPEGGEIDVQIPPGTISGTVLRLRGKGGPGTPPGDALIEVDVGLHPFFTREGQDIFLELPVSVQEAVLGGRVTVPTITGSVTMAIPEGSDSGTKLRLRGKGIPAHGNRPAGDAFATLRIVIGPQDQLLRDAMRARPAFDPRRELLSTVDMEV